MSSGCRFSVDARSPARATYVNLYKWPESDVEFVKSVAGGAGRSNSRRRWVPGRPGVVDSVSCRQMYLRSYTFTTKKETVLGRVKKRAALSTEKKGCAMVVRKLREASRTVMDSIVGRLLACTTSVDVMDRRPRPKFCD